MLKSGLVSVTFRKLSPREVVDLVKKSGLDGIEWGGDIHVPHGDLPKAKEAGAMTRDAGLEVSAYGSYYKVGHSDELAFEPVLDSAAALGAPLIRVWAGKKGSADADADYRRTIVEDSRRIADLAAKRGIQIAYEFHGKTLTDTRDSAVLLLKEVDHPNMKSLWQAQVKGDIGERLADLDAVTPWLTNVHAYCWEGTTRLPLAQGAADWARYLPKLQATGRDHTVLIEFVLDNTPEQFLQDAAALKGWIAAL